MRANKPLILFVLLFTTASMIMGVNSVVAEINPELKLTERQKHQIVRQLGFDGMEYIKRLGCETSIATYIKTDKWDDQWCYENYRQLDYSKIDKPRIIFPKVREKGDSY